MSQAASSFKAHAPAEPAAAHAPIATWRRKLASMLRAVADRSDALAYVLSKEPRTRTKTKVYVVGKDYIDVSRIGLEEDD